MHCRALGFFVHPLLVKCVTELGMSGVHDGRDDVVKMIEMNKVEGREHLAWLPTYVSPVPLP